VESWLNNYRSWVIPGFSWGRGRKEPLGGRGGLARYGGAVERLGFAVDLKTSVEQLKEILVGSGGKSLKNREGEITLRKSRGGGTASGKKKGTSGDEQGFLFEEKRRRVENFWGMKRGGVAPSQGFCREREEYWGSCHQDEKKRVGR